MFRSRRYGVRTAKAIAAAVAVVAVAGGVGVAAAPVRAQAPTDELQPTLVEPQLRQELADDSTTDFWVYLHDRPDLAPALAGADRAAAGELVYERLTTTAANSQAQLRELLAAEDAAYESFWIANAVKVTGDEALLERITDLPEVARVAADRVYELPEPVPAVEQPRVGGVEWGIDRIRAPRVWDELGVTGEGIVVGIIDSGALVDHPALVDSYRGNLGGGELEHDYHWHEPFELCMGSFGEPCDSVGHGTHVTGTVVGDDGGGNHIGVAPGARWIAANGCPTGNCTQGALLSSGQFMLAPTDLNGENPRPDLRPHLVNNSWGAAAADDPWYQQTVQAWEAAGIFPVFAVGNDGPECGTAGNPGNLPESYAVGAFDVNGAIADFSSRGPSAFGDGLVKPDIAAPGAAIRSSWSDGGYHTISGTSMATPHVAGTVALMWSAAPDLVRDVSRTRELLDGSAVDVDDTSCGGTAADNHVWGEGRLDAWAAVDQAPGAAIGRLTGTVTEDGTGAQVADATVSLTGAVQRTRSTGEDGEYSVWLPAGEYELTVTRFGYEPDTRAVTVVQDETTMQDVALAAVATVTVSGQVTDGSGHGWPLYARVAVAGTPEYTFTDPLTGEYQLEVPADAEHRLELRPQYDGYQQTSVPVEAGAGDLDRDVAVEVADCLRAPGYEYGARVGVFGDPAGHLGGFLAERGIPSTEYQWRDDPAEYDVIIVNRPDIPARDDFMHFLNATDDAGTGVLFLDTAPFTDQRVSGIAMLWRFTRTPTLALGGTGNDVERLFYEVAEEHPILGDAAPGERLTFDETSPNKPHGWFLGYVGDGRRVLATAGRSDQGVLGSGIAVQQRERNRHVLLSMHGASTGGAGTAGPGNWTGVAAEIFTNAVEWATPDAVFECSAVDGGLVIGQVTDRNTGEPVERAVVTTPDEAGRGVSAAIADDAAVGDGFYWLLSPTTGDVEITASAHQYASTAKSTPVTANAATRLDLVLPAGELAVEPERVAGTLRQDQVTNRTFTVTNTGTAAAEVALGERRGAGTPEKLRTVDGGAQVRRLPGEFSPNARPSGVEEAVAPGHQPAGRGSSPGAGATAQPWADIADYPQPIMDSSAAVLRGRVYSIGGLRTERQAIPEFRSYVYEPVAHEWERIADLPVPRQKPAVAAIDGLVYAIGGWNRDLEPTTSTFVYDPAQDSWSTAADLPVPRAASATAVLDGRLYLITGCDGEVCGGSRDTWRYDPVADEWQALADYPQPVAWQGCAGAAGRLVCTGGIDADTSISAATYTYDPTEDRWTPASDAPYHNWGMAYAAAGDHLVISGGITTEDGRSTVTNESAVYDPRDDAWHMLAPAGRPVYRAAGACGFYKIGGTLEAAGFTPLPGAEIHPKLDDCTAGGVDLPWLTVDPATVTLQPQESVTVTVELAAGAMETGEHTAGVAIGHDTPYDVAAVPATMSVRPPLACDRTVNSIHFGPLTVADGVTCLADGARLFGPVTVAPGAGLVAGDAMVTGPLSANGARMVELVGTTITGPVSIRETTATVRLDRAHVTGPVRLDDNVVDGGLMLLSGVTVVGPLSCTGNDPAPADEGVPNSVRGRTSGQCASS